MAFFVIEPDVEGFVPTQGAVEGHYLRCPHCHGYADLVTHCCKTCGARAITILWWRDPCITISPELTMVTRRR